ncbi:MAG TPA: hypothetical protein VMV82_07340 [Candidatus Dormibacteraeota bacterium]|nr:hypothetical protein [Candidatus Dormibacteraeota bacterium]
MNSSEAREHLEMAERIVAASTRELSLRYAAPFFIAWGLASGTVCLIFQLIERGLVPATATWASGGLLAAAVIFSVVYARRKARCARLTFLQREFLNVLWIAMGVAFVSNAGGWNIFPTFGLSAIYTIAASIVLFYIGLHENRRALLGGIILLVSLVVANFMPTVVGYVLAAGFYLGYAGFGVAELMARE